MRMLRGPATWSFVFFSTLSISASSLAAEGVVSPITQQARQSQQTQQQGQSESTGKPEPLNETLRPEGNPPVADLYRDMGVVQRRAMAKSQRFLLSTYGSFDFSDGPYTLYSFNLNPGYAISDFLEIYLNVAPVFFSSARKIVDEVAALQNTNGQPASIVSPKPKHQYGAEILWAPMYGKDSFGLHSIVRSDTFVKFGASQISYEGGDTGMRFVLGVGKTFFLTQGMGLRLTADAGEVQSTLNGDKSFRMMALLETGLIVYF